jgi:hypothetical protein
MKSEINKLMKEQGLDALWVMGSGDHNPNMVYFTGLHHITIANLFILQGKEPVLLHQSMEREEAQKTGLHTISMNDYPFSDFMKLAEGDALKAYGLTFQKILTDLGLTRGKVAVSGLKDVGSTLVRLNELKRILPDIEFMGVIENDPFEVARLTKDEKEIERIRLMGKITTEIVGLTADYLSDLHEKLKRRSGFGWRSAMWNHRKRPSLPWAGTRASRTAQAIRVMSCALVCRLCLISSPVKPGVDISTISPAPGASVMPPRMFKRYMTRCCKCIKRLPPNSKLILLSSIIKSGPVNYLRQWVTLP